MTAMEFWKRFGTAKTREVCGMAGTTFEYFEHIAHGRKRPSADMATALSDASAALTSERIDAASMRKAQAAPSRREALRRERAEAFARSKLAPSCAGSV